MSDPNQNISNEKPHTPSGTAEDATALQPKTENSAPDTAVQDDGAVKTAETAGYLAFAEKWGKYVAGGVVPPSSGTSPEVAMRVLRELEEENARDIAEMVEAEREATMKASTQKSSEAATEAKEEEFGQEKAARKGSDEKDGQQN